MPFRTRLVPRSLFVLALACTALAGACLAGACSGATAPSAGAPDSDAAPAPLGSDAAPAPLGSVVARITVRDPRASGGAQSDVIVTFGHPFSAGALPAGRTLVARATAGGPLATQVDVKATHADGSARHVVVTVLVPHLDTATPLNASLINVDMNALFLWTICCPNDSWRR